MILQVAADAFDIGHDGNAEAARISESPTPDSSRTCGVFTAPPERITSRIARTCCSLFFCAYSTPTAREPSNSTRVTCAWDSILRLGRSSAGTR